MESKRVFFAAHLSSETQSLFWWTLSSGRTNGYKDVSHQIPPIFWATSSSFKRWSVPLNHVYESVDDRYRSRPCIATLASVLWKPKIHTPPRKLRWLAGKSPFFLNRRYILKRLVFFHFQLSFQGECTPTYYLSKHQPGRWGGCIREWSCVWYLWGNFLGCRWATRKPDHVEPTCCNLTLTGPLWWSYGGTEDSIFCWAKILNFGLSIYFFNWIESTTECCCTAIAPHALHMAATP